MAYGAPHPSRKRREETHSARISIAPRAAVSVGSRLPAGKFSENPGPIRQTPLLSEHRNGASVANPRWPPRPSFRAPVRRAPPPKVWAIGVDRIDGAKEEEENPPNPRKSRNLGNPGLGNLAREISDKCARMRASPSPKPKAQSGDRKRSKIYAPVAKSRENGSPNKEERETGCAHGPSYSSLIPYATQAKGGYRRLEYYPDYFIAPENRQQFERQEIIVRRAGAAHLGGAPESAAYLRWFPSKDRFTDSPWVMRSK